MTSLPRSGVAGASAALWPRASLRRARSATTLLLWFLPLVLLVSACGSGSSSSGARPAGTGGVAPAVAAGGSGTKVLNLGAIPDQNQDQLQKIYGTLAAYLTEKLGVRVRYRPVTNYSAAVSQFRTGDLDLVWFGGLTSVQAYLQTSGSKYLVQRNIDGSFHSLFIVNTSTGVKPLANAAGLSALKGKRFTFGSNSSTSGYLMPAYYLLKAGVDPQHDFTGQAGFSGSHDKTIDLVQSGTYQAGAVNEQVWDSRVKAGTVDLSKVRVVWRTPAYHDYNWLLGKSATAKFGPGFAAKVRDAFLGISSSDPQGAKILTLFGCSSFVPTSFSNYAKIETVGKKLGLIQQ